MNFVKAQIKRFFETGKWAMKLIFLVVLVELGLVVGVVATTVSYTHLTLPTKA